MPNLHGVNTVEYVLLSIASGCLGYWLAKKKYRNKIAWSIVLLIFPVYPLVILLLLPPIESQYRNYSKNSASRFVKRFKGKKGNYTVSLAELSAALRIDVRNYVIDYTEDNERSKQLAIQSIALQSSRAAYITGAVTTSIFSFISRELMIRTLKSLYFNVNEIDKPVADYLSKLFIDKKITDDDYIKGLASIAFNHGNNIISSAREDAFGQPSFVDEDTRYYASLAYDFFADYSVEKSDVLKLCSEHGFQMPTEKIVTYNTTN